MKTEYIERNKVRDAVAGLATARFEVSNAYRVYIEALKNVDAELMKIPAADVEPVRHGKWIICKTYNPAFKGFECSECGAQFQGYRPDNYCGNCGAKMDEQMEDTDG